MTGDRELLHTRSRIDFEPGGDLRESACGTNAVGTAVADDRPLQLIGADNFDPFTHSIVGVIDVTADCRLIEPRMISTINQAALEIEERLASEPLVEVYA